MGARHRRNALTGETFLEGALYPTAVSCGEAVYVAQDVTYPLVALDETRSVETELRRRTLLTAEPDTTDPIPDDGRIQPYQHADGERTASSARSFGGRPFVLELEEPSEPLQHGIDQCTFPRTELEWPFPYQPVFFDDVTSLEDATDVVVEARTTRDLGTMVLRDLGDIPVEPEPEPEPGEPGEPDDGAEETAGGFSAVSADFTHAEGIAWLVDQGITTGRPDGTFGPGDPGVRGQMATFLFRAVSWHTAERRPPGSHRRRDLHPRSRHRASSNTPGAPTGAANQSRSRSWLACSTGMARHDAVNPRRRPTWPSQGDSVCARSAVRSTAAVSRAGSVRT